MNAQELARREDYGAVLKIEGNRRCPKCGCERTAASILPSFGLSRVETRYCSCLKCGTMWEAYPVNWGDDTVDFAREHGGCDNCAFKSGSPEQTEPDAWKALVEKLKAGAEFKCHKGCPIKGIRNHSETFGTGKVKRTLEFDAAWIRRHGRICGGFLRVLWAWRDKGYDWIAARYPGETK